MYSSHSLGRFAELWRLQPDMLREMDVGVNFWRRFSALIVPKQ